MTSPEDINKRFRYSPAESSERVIAHESIRGFCWNLAEFLNEKLPDGREKSLAITKVEESMFWANAAVARNG